eukprot:CAMPEP_0198312166 /NCGR_PEP_ID=MMETSP1450-20131203/3641_1 /TAXON_ID=753684 ORGANISM="Madagascaria erythrocladiodes, Strain CCMP3234" /NCGR_SAMPLE_ID=MMETSP1450 /ASSEMBLY_ACC=CAM_ASM_001115 /LENGTH=305 /DNA_ID=CAMNT_0044015101 /DNA_START=13 /DNA_END=930 /DNA_ORIENTATION=-
MAVPAPAPAPAPAEPLGHSPVPGDVTASSSTQTSERRRRAQTWRSGRISRRLLSSPNDPNPYPDDFLEDEPRPRSISGRLLRRSGSLLRTKSLDLHARRVSETATTENGASGDARPKEASTARAMRRSGRIGGGMRSMFRLKPGGAQVAKQANSRSTKVLFLDIDGVLHSVRAYSFFQEKCMDELKQICAETNAKVVISSNWRRNEGLLSLAKKKLKGHGIEVIDHTPMKYSLRSRPEEIAAWLDEHPYIEVWAALDDMSMTTTKREVAVRVKDRCVQTDGVRGLTPEQTVQVIAILNGNPMIDP